MENISLLYFPATGNKITILCRSSYVNIVRAGVIIAFVLMVTPYLIGIGFSRHDLSGIRSSSSIVAAGIYIAILFEAKKSLRMNSGENPAYVASVIPLIGGFTVVMFVLSFVMKGISFFAG